ncbi:unnamed protein product [Didymodactylos carnosus]|uniref:PX domain-containing protein n=1 Tax=Didymodactylos carnosus TaxID=1234261 RepID=A0A814E3B4_9BILA|nr:unnamed protein product [Didymodactylos carnosus]CAF0961924.1 unnamed protein product [Didymodactylos carnosus]CAF3541008.1 unnamed protein product [Didymodactylos carnosus]CAF3736274.1 unnamed protein product [Didymodactylos carnosus]
MHFSIPHSTNSKDSASGVTFALYHIHINGTHHSSLRYSQLRTFNEELHRLFSPSTIYILSFPPKKLFLSTTEKEKRRLQLERYLQSIIQHKSIVTSTYFQRFFLHSQRKTFQYLLEGKENQDEKLEFSIFLLNNHQLKIQIYPTDNTQRLLDLLAIKIQLSTDFLSYFGLFLIKNDDKSTLATDILIIRQLVDFEAPYLSLEYMKRKTNDSSYCVILRKSYWDITCDNLLLSDQKARNLLFIQVQHELEHNNCLSKNIPDDIKRQLLTLKESNSFKEYVLLAKHLKYYGYSVIKYCSMLFPLTNDQQSQKLYQCELAIGNSELVCIISDINRELTFKVTRIRCWRVTSTSRQQEQQPMYSTNSLSSIITTNTVNDTAQTTINDEDMDLSFEYLISKESLKWITINTLQATLISAFLQNMVDEILTKRGGQTLPTDDSKSSISLTSKQSSQQIVSSTKFGNVLVNRAVSDLSKPNNMIFDYDDDANL